MNKFEIAFATALLTASSSAALAQGTYNQGQAHQNRHVRQQSVQPLQQRNVALPTEGRSASGPFWYNWSGPSSGGM